MVDSSPREGQQIRLTPGALGRFGDAIGEVSGKSISVFGAIPGETVVAEVVRERRTHVEARVTEVSDPSPYRVEPTCPYFGVCTGCQWQHIGYAHQLVMKHDAVRDALEGATGLKGIDVPPTLPSPMQLGYRNHARFTVRRENGRLGFINRMTRRWVEVEECQLMDPWVNRAVAQLQGQVAETTQLSLRHGLRTGSWLLQPRLQAQDVPMVSGQKHYEEVLAGRRFRISSPSFFQVNTLQAERLADIVVRELALTGEETVVDAYAGVGTFAAILAPRAKRVIAIEEASAAVADMRANVESLSNVEVMPGRTEEILGQLHRRGGVDAVVLDPSRSGCHAHVLDVLVRLSPRRIVYVSCDVGTLVRDLKALAAGPYRIDRVQPVDMFPQTHHVECVATLSRDDARLAAREARQFLILASASPRRRALVQAAGLRMEVIASNLDETIIVDPDPVKRAVGLALAKARSVAAQRQVGTVVGADTVVALDGRILGKPKDAGEALEMLRALRGREHWVVTGIAVVDSATGEWLTAHSSSRVVMRAYTEEEAAAYVASGDPMDKAGAYGVQSGSFRPAVEVHGSYSNVVGLPVAALLKLLRRFGVHVPVNAIAHERYGPLSRVGC